MADEATKVLSTQGKRQPQDISAWDKAIQFIRQAEAQSRFTKTPIYILNNSRYGSSTPSSGLYDRAKQRIIINQYGSRENGQFPNYSDLMNTIHHEDIHALLEKSGINNPDIPNSDVRFRALESLGMGSRAGNYVKEAPAYVGAFSPDQMPSFSPQDRTNWLAKFLPTLPPQVAQLFQRIMSNSAAAQGPLPTQAP